MPNVPKLPPRWGAVLCFIFVIAIFVLIFVANVYRNAKHPYFIRAVGVGAIAAGLADGVKYWRKANRKSASEKETGPSDVPKTNQDNSN